MKAINNEQLLQQLNWRYATKQCDPQRKIGAADWATLEEALLLTPSGGGLQPWKFIVVTDPTVRAKLTPASYGQAQINAASHLVVFAAKQNFSEADVDAHLKNLAQIQGAPLEALAPLRGMLVGTVIGVLIIPGLYYLFGELDGGRKLLKDESHQPLSERLIHGHEDEHEA